MATKPTSVPEWATSGSAALLEPLLAEKQLGWVPGSRGPAQWFNWWMRLVYLWMVWLDAFESEAHTWSALQTFNARVESHWGSGGPSAAVYGNNTSIGAGLFPGVFGESDNGVGLIGIGLLAGVSGALQAGAPAGASGVSGSGIDAATYGGSFSHDLGGVALRVSTGGVTAGPAALQVAAGPSAFGIEVSGGTSRAISAVTTATGVGTAALRAQGGRTGLIGLPAAGTNGSGASLQGDGTGPGGVATGGTTGAGFVGEAGFSGNGNGLEGIGAGSGAGVYGLGGGTGPGGKFERGDADTTKAAISCAGAMAFAAVADLAGNQPILNALHRKLVIKAWALIQLNNTAAPTILDRMNVSGVTQQLVGNGIITFTMPQAMASTSYAIIREVDSDVSNGRVARATPSSTTVFTVELFDPSAPTVVLSALNSNNHKVFVAVIGAQ